MTGTILNPLAADLNDFMYRILDQQKTIETLKTLSRRIDERFPSASLTGVCREVQTIAEETCGRIAWLAKPHGIIRGAIFAVIGLAIALGFYVIRRVKFHTDGFSIEELEAATNAAFLLGASLFFLFGLESRLKRRNVLSAINELRAISHVIDMHQLTKDPSRLLASADQMTESSPQRTLTPFQLTRYLDYCSELLSLVGKLAALYAQSTTDGIVLAAVNDIETLTNGISRKIWQKIMILDDDLDALQGSAPKPVTLSESRSDSAPPAAAPRPTSRPLTDPADARQS